MNFKRIFGTPVAALLLTLMAVAPAWAAVKTVTYTGQGFNFDGTTHNLNDERCGVAGQYIANDGGTGQFANWNGPGQPYQSGDSYLVWVLTANGATSATLNLPNGAVSMIQVGGTFKYASAYYPYATLVGLPVSATVVASKFTNPQLTVSHGCQPYDTDAAWCSPGFWRNAQDAAWTLIGVDKAAAYNATVVPTFHATSSPANPTLIQVLTTAGANTFGNADAPYGLNAFNATGAYLTSRIPGFAFDVSLVGAENACPIDNHGNYKAP